LGKKREKQILKEEIYIINGDSGQSLFFHSFSKLDHDAELFAGLFTAILQFASAYSKNNIGEFSMAKLKIYIWRSADTPLIYVYIYDRKLKKSVKNIAKTLSSTAQEFESMFPLDSIVNWNGDVCLFKDFLKNIVTIFHPWEKFESIF
jgi:hypothetical protein